MFQGQISWFFRGLGIAKQQFKMPTVIFAWNMVLLIQRFVCFVVHVHHGDEIGPRSLPTTLFPNYRNARKISTPSTLRWNITAFFRVHLGSLIGRTLRALSKWYTKRTDVPVWAYKISLEMFIKPLCTLVTCIILCTSGTDGTKPMSANAGSTREKFRIFESDSLEKSCAKHLKIFIGTAQYTHC